jgi:hypothetical protein
MKDEDVGRMVGIGIFGIIIVVAYIVLMPLAFIWAIDRLFFFGCRFDFGNWLASLIILTILRTRFTK